MRQPPTRTKKGFCNKCRGSFLYAVDLVSSACFCAHWFQIQLYDQFCERACTADYFSLNVHSLKLSSKRYCQSALGIGSQISLRSFSRHHRTLKRYIIELVHLTFVIGAMQYVTLLTCTHFTLPFTYTQPGRARDVSQCAVVMPSSPCVYRQVYPADMPVRLFAELSLSEVSNIEDGPTRAEVERALRLTREAVLQSEVGPEPPARLPIVCVTSFIGAM